MTCWLQQVFDDRVCPESAEQAADVEPGHGRHGGSHDRHARGSTNLRLLLAVALACRRRRAQASWTFVKYSECPLTWCETSTFLTRDVTGVKPLKPAADWPPWAVG